MYRRVVSAIELADFQATEQQSLTYVAGEPASNQWTYDATMKAVKANADRGYFRFYLGQVAFGDKINIKADVYNISGIKTHASVDFSDTSYNFSETKGTSGLYNTSKLEDWEQININYVADMDSLYTSVVIGLSTGKVGQYYLKNVVITVQSVYPGISSITAAVTGTDTSRVVKYSDGRMEISMRAILTNVDVSGAWGAIFGSAQLALPNFPVPFIEIPIVSITPSTVGQSFMSELVVQPTITNPGYLSLFRGTAATINTLWVDIIAKGRWK